MDREALMEHWWIVTIKHRGMEVGELGHCEEPNCRGIWCRRGAMEERLNRVFRFAPTRYFGFLNL